MQRRNFLKFGGAALALVATPLHVRKALAQTSPAQVLNCSFNLANNSSYPDTGSPDGSVYHFPGAATTANTVTLHPNLMPGWTVLYARWVCAWNPNTATSSPANAQLIYCDDGPSNIGSLAVFSHSNYTNPIDDTVDITSVLKPLWNAWRDAGIYKHIGHRTAGNGTNSPLIYGSQVELYLTPG